MAVQIPVAAIAKHCNPFKAMPWGTRVTEKMVKTALDAGQIASVPIPNQRTQGNRIPASRHAARIAYFVTEGFGDPIQLDVGVPELGAHTSWLIADGNHRFAAALYSGQTSIACEVSGSVKFAQELFGVNCEDPQYRRGSK